MQKPWFTKKGWVYLPISVAGGFVTFFLFIFCINVFLVIDSHAHSVSDTLYGIFPFVVPTFLLYIWIASETSKK